MDAVRIYLEDIDTRVSLSSGSSISFKVNGLLDKLRLTTNPSNGKGLDGAFITKERSLSQLNVFCKTQGAGGNLKVDLRRIKQVARPILSIDNIFSANTQSIARGSAAIFTQSITKAETNLFTQAVDFYKPVENVTDIINVGFQQWRYNLVGTSVLDSEYEVGDYIIVSGATNSGNNGVFQIFDLNQENGKNLVLLNATGVQELGSGATCQANFARYDFTGAVPTHYQEGEQITFSLHTDASADGTYNIFKKNISGNNLIVKLGLVPLVSQGAPAGQVECFRFKYSFLTAVQDAFAIGEVAEFTAHTNAVNDGSFEIQDTNYTSGNKIISDKNTGDVQGGVSGNINTNRWVYALDSNPLGFFEIGDTASISGSTNAQNDGTFSIVDVRYLATDNIVVYNALGTVQAGAVGVVTHTNKVINFQDDYSADFDPNNSYIDIIGTTDVNNQGTFLVVDTNRTAISPYNIIVDMPLAVTQSYALGSVEKEVRSIFNSPVIYTLTQDNQVFTSTVLEGVINATQLKSGTVLLFDILEAPIGAIDISCNLN